MASQDLRDLAHEDNSRKESGQAGEWSRKLTSPRRKAQQPLKLKSSLHAKRNDAFV
jgi:hypothetical protein